MITQKIFNNPEYDLIDTNEKRFEEDFLKFREKMKELEKRLASVITQSFDDLNTLSDRFKLLESFDVLIKRPII